MSEIICSSPTRRIVRHLEGIGVSIRDIHDQLDLEMAALWFYPNHIEGVISKIMRGGNVATKLLKAQDRGWEYFHGPVWSMLQSRSGAMREDGIEVDNEDPTTTSVYRLVTGRLLERDFPMKEARELFEVVVPLVREHGLDIKDAIRACTSRNVYYLRGILSSRAQEHEHRVRRVKEGLASGPASTIDQNIRMSTRDVDAARALWENNKADIDLLRRLNEYRK